MRKNVIQNFEIAFRVFAIVWIFKSVFLFFLQKVFRILPIVILKIRISISNIRISFFETVIRNTKKTLGINELTIVNIQNNYCENTNKLLMK